MRHIFLSGLAAVLLIPAAAQAATPPQIVACHGCSESRARLTAQSQVPRSWGPGVYDVYVVDTGGGKLRRYRVTSEFEGRLWEKYAMPRTPASNYQTWFNQGYSEWLYARNAAKPGIVLGSDIPVRSAEQVIGSAFNQMVVSEQINRSIPARIGSLFGAALSMFRTIFTNSIFIEVGFADGSTARFVLDRIDSLSSGHMFVYVYEPGSARDSDGNAIPDSAAAYDSYEGVFSSEYNLDLFLRRSRMYDADFFDPLNNLELLPAHFVCAWDDGGQIKCWRH